jgi:hypothetical protein
LIDGSIPHVRAEASRFSKFQLGAVSYILPVTMDARKKLGSWLRRERQKRGFHSAAGLSRAARIALAHTASIERGAFCPTWRTATRLADALQLEGSDREQFFHLVDQAGKTADARAATAGLFIPGLVLWKHLPALLFHQRVVESHVAEFVPTDDTLPDGVAVFASVLSAVALSRGMLAGRELDAMRRARDELVRGLLHVERPQLVTDGAVSRDALIALRARLPIAWRECLFSSPRTARGLVSLLAQWNCQRIYSDQAAQFSAWFRDSALDRQFGFMIVPVPALRAVHDFFAAQFLWHALEVPVPFPFTLQRSEPCDPPADAGFIARVLTRARFYESGRRVERARPVARSSVLSSVADDLRLLRRLYLLPLPARTGLLPPRVRFSALARRIDELYEGESAENRRIAERLEQLGGHDEPPTCQTEPGQ